MSEGFRRLALATVIGFWLAAPPAAALPTCGSLGQPVCAEAPAPGAEVTLTGDANQGELAPLSVAPSPSVPLWPRVRGHEPYGFNAVSAGTDGITVDDEALLHEEIGASLARLSVDWGVIQYYPNSAEGGQPWNYAQLDARYRAFVRRGVRPLLTIVKAPRRFTVNAATPRGSPAVGCGYSDACHNPPTAEHLDKLATFAADLARRYPLAAGIELWNEPNLSNPFWGGQPIDPEHYAAMLAAAHDAAKAIRPALPVIGGSVAAVGVTRIDETGYERMAMRTFVARMLRAGAAEDMDAISYHPYLGTYPTAATRAQEDQALYIRILAQDHAVLGGYSDAGEPLNDRVVVTEFGASTTDGFTEERQAAWLRLRYWLWDTDHPYMPLPVDAAIIHRAVEQVEPNGVIRPRTGFGLVRPRDGKGRFALKEAYCAFRTEFGGFPDCPGFLRLARHTGKA